MRELNYQALDPGGLSTMKKLLAESVLLLALGAFAAAQTTPSTAPSNTNNNGTVNPTQQQTTPVPNPNAAPAPDVNTNPSNSGTASPNGSATPDATTNKSGDADQNTATTPPASTTTQDQTTTTTSTTQTAKNTASGKDNVVGCLESAGSGQFTIRTKSDKTVPVIATSMFSGNLSDHVGERVRATGTYSSSDTAMNGNPSPLPQSDQPATGKNEKDNPAKDATIPPTAASGTSAANASNANGTPAANPDSGMATTDSAKREFRADSVATLSKTCGNSSNPR
jgi:hypothetical protein